MRWQPAGRSTLKAFYLFFCGSIFSGIILLLQWHTGQAAVVINLLHTANIPWILIGFGLTAILTQLLRSRSYACVNKTASVSPLSYFTIVFSAILAWMLLGETLSLLSWVGIVLIIIGGLVLLYRKKAS